MALDFDASVDNSQWWEDINISSRRLPFSAYAAIFRSLP